MLLNVNRKACKLALGVSKWAVPRQLSDIELGVAKRLTDAREYLGIGQTAAADRLMISRNRLVTYEAGRVAVPWEVGERFCSNYGFSQLWLATGELPRRIYVPLPPSDSRASFHQLVTREFVERIRAFHSLLAQQLRVEKEELDPIDSGGAEPLRLPFGWWRGVANSSAALVTRFAEGMPPELYEELAINLSDTLCRFEEMHAREIKEYHAKLREFDAQGLFAAKVESREEARRSIASEQKQRRGSDSPCYPALKGVAIGL